MKKIKISFLALSAICFAFVSCKEEETVTPAETSKVLVVHASPNAPGVDLYVDQVKLNSAALTFPANTGYLTANAGSRRIQVKVNPSTTSSASAIDATLPLTKDVNYSVYAIDSVSKISPLVTVDDLTAPASGKAHIRFIHLSPNAPAVDVSVAGQAAGAGLFLNRTFNKTITPAQYAFIPVDAGTYNLEVRAAGTTTSVLDLTGVTLTAGKIYTVFAKGFFGGTGAQALGAEIIVNK